MDTMIPQVLVAVEEKEKRQMLIRIIEAEGLKALSVPHGSNTISAVCVVKPDLVLLDAGTSIPGGMEVLKEIKDVSPALPVVFIASSADVKAAVEAVKKGAHDYLAMPLDDREVLRVIRRALAESESQTRAKNSPARPDNGKITKSNLTEFMGHSSTVMRLLTDVNRVARSNFTVVITGETGTGKELVARAIHDASLRSQHPFVAVDCGSIPETLLESELFGHEKGSFTGADALKKGKFEMAQKGTLFMDEIGNMPLSSQAKFLRVLQDKQIYRVGSTRPIDIDIRIITATNLDLQEMAAENRFRPDLFYRLSEFTISVPPLRERREDVPYLAQRFLEAANVELGKEIKDFADDALELMMAYHWPGNVRQLRTAVRAAALAARDTITKNHLNLQHAQFPSIKRTPQIPEFSWRNTPLSEIVSQSTMAVERDAISRALMRTGGNKAKAARLLQIDYKTMQTKIKKYEISVGH